MNNRCVSLIGFMGTGKSTAGRAASKRLGLEFFDSDDYAAELAGMSVSDMFRRFGEGAFRRTEERAISEICSRRFFLIATGGGAILSEKNRQTLKNRSVVIWLRSDLLTILSNLEGDDSRPLLQGDPEKNAERLLAVRESFYAGTADFIVDVSGKSVDETADEIIDKLGEV